MVLGLENEIKECLLGGRAKGRPMKRWKTRLGVFVGISGQESSMEDIVKIKQEDFSELKKGIEQ